MGKMPTYIQRQEFQNNLRPFINYTKSQKRNDIFQALKVNKYQLNMLSPTKLSFKIYGEIRIFQNKHKLGCLMSIKSDVNRKFSKEYHDKNKKGSLSVSVHDRIHLKNDTDEQKRMWKN